MKKEPRFLRTQKPGWARRIAPCHTVTGYRLVLGPVSVRGRYGAPLIWPQRPAAGSVSARGSRQKPAFAWCYPPLLLPPCPGVRVRKSDRARSLYPDFPHPTTLFRVGARLSGTVCACGGEGTGLQGRVLARRGCGTRDRPWTHYRKLAKPRDAKPQSRLDRN